MGLTAHVPTHPVFSLRLCLSSAFMPAPPTVTPPGPATPCVCFSLSGSCYFPTFPQPTNRYRDAQLILAGKGYGLMYSIWARFRDIIERGSGLTKTNPLRLSLLQVLISSLTLGAPLMVVLPQ